MAFTFEDASPERGYIKCLLYGLSGGGKTFSALKFATAIGKTLVIDTENKAGLYAPTKDKPRENDFPMFKIYHTKAVMDVIGILKQLKRSKEFDCIIIDSLSHIWDSCVTTYMRTEQMKHSHIYTTYSTKGLVEYGAWNGIKKIWKELITLILDVESHIFATARLKIILDQTTFVKIAEEPAIEKFTPYDFTTLIKMEKGVTKSDVDCYVENDWCIGGEYRKNPDITLWKPVLERFKVSTHLPLPEEDGVIDNTPPSYNINPIKKESNNETVVMIEEEQQIVLKRQMKKTEYKYEDWESKLNKLTKSQANTLIQQLMGDNYSFFTLSK